VFGREVYPDEVCEIEELKRRRKAAKGYRSEALFLCPFFNAFLT